MVKPDTVLSTFFLSFFIARLCARLTRATTPVAALPVFLKSTVTAPSSTLTSASRVSSLRMSRYAASRARSRASSLSRSLLREWRPFAVTTTQRRRGTVARGGAPTPPRRDAMSPARPSVTRRVSRQESGGIRARGAAIWVIVLDAVIIATTTKGRGRGR